MMKENNGQVSLEYLLIFAISIILLIVFTLPLAEISIENTMDVSNSLNVKSELSKLSNAINLVYSEGHGSKQTVYITLDEPVNVKISNSYLSSNYKLSDGKYKDFKLDYNSNLNKGSLFLDNGENKIIVEWPVNDEKMIIYKKY